LNSIIDLLSKHSQDFFKISTEEQNNLTPTQPNNELQQTESDEKEHETSVAAKEIIPSDLNKEKSETNEEAIENIPESQPEVQPAAKEENTAHDHDSSSESTDLDSSEDSYATSDEDSILSTSTMKRSQTELPQANENSTTKTTISTKSLSSISSTRRLPVKKMNREPDESTLLGLNLLFLSVLRNNKISKDLMKECGLVPYSQSKAQLILEYLTGEAGHSETALQDHSSSDHNNTLHDSLVSALQYIISNGSKYRILTLQTSLAVYKELCYHPQSISWKNIHGKLINVFIVTSKNTFSQIS